MIDHRIVLRIFCSKKGQPHQVGAVVATGSGYRIDWTAPVRDLDPRRGDGVGYRDEGVPQSERLVDAETVGSNAWCGVCRKSMPITHIGDALRAGRRSVRLQAMGMYEDSPRGGPQAES